MPGHATSAPEAVAGPRTRSKTTLWLPSAFLGAIVLLAATLQLFPYPEGNVVARATTLASYFPSRMSGWTGTDLPLAETEANQGAVEKILNFDEALLRSFRKGDRQFSVYVAYWKGGKMPSREIAFHIPDKCWPTSGWKRTAVVHDYAVSLGDHKLAPGQYREFEFREQHQNVLYWHVFNGQVIVYNRDGSPSDSSIFTDLLRRGIRQRGEQYFIRLTSSTPLTELLEDEGFREILELVAPLGPGLSSALKQF